MRSWFLASLLAAAALSSPAKGYTVASVSIGEFSQGASATQLFRQYSVGYFSNVAKQLAQVPDFEVFETDVAQMLKVLPQEAQGAGAAFALEAAYAAYSARSKRPGDLTRSTMAARRLLEMGCTIVRRQLPGTGFERQWALASLSLMSGDSYPVDLLDVSAFDKHLGHLKDRIDPGVLTLARGVNREQRVGRLTAEWALQDFDRPLSGRALDQGQSVLRAATEALSAARSYPEVATEALVRLGFVATIQQQLTAIQGHAERPTRVLDQLRTIDAMTTDTGLRYLGHLFAGRSDELAGDRHSAMEEYRRATSAVRGRTALLALAALEFLDGDERDSQALTQEVQGLSELSDPWLQYFAGSYREWPQRLANLREALK